MLRKNPGFTLVAVASLAIGIGANCAMFSLADALLLRPMPALRPGEVVTVGTAQSLQGFSALVASYRDYVDLRDQSKSFGGLAAFAEGTFGFATQADALPQIKLGTFVTGNFFPVMGVEPELGRAFRPEENVVPGRDAVMILDHDTWEKEFAGDRGVLGRKVRINGIEFTEGTFEIDPNASPKGMVIKGTDGPNKGKVIPAIYEMQGKTLRICYDLSGTQRPKDFKSLPGTKLYLVRYERQK